MAGAITGAKHKLPRTIAEKAVSYQLSALRNVRERDSPSDVISSNAKDLGFDSEPKAKSQEPAAT
jgi:hypothetical protein